MRKILFAAQNPVRAFQLHPDGQQARAGTFFATQRPNKLNEAILNETTEPVCFRLEGNNGLDCLAVLGVIGEESAN